jgi:hypothetical protein
MGPWERAPIRVERSRLRAHSAGGELRNQLRIRERYRSDIAAFCVVLCVFDLLGGGAVVECEAR